MGLTEKIDVLDMIINIMTEHEKTMDDLVAKMEKIIPDGCSYSYPTTVRRWGNSRGAYIPQSIWMMADIDVGDEIIISLRKSARVGETLIRYGRSSKYDPIIDSFILGSDSLVVVDVPDKGANYLRTQLRNRIEARRLKGIKVSVVNKMCYLEKCARGEG
jgi:hypothetical protein